MHQKTKFGKGRVKGDRMVYPALPFGDHFQSKIEKRHPNRYAKIDAEKVLKIDAKRGQNEAKIDAEIIDFSYFFEKGENARNYLFYNIKRGSGHLKI